MDYTIKTHFMLASALDRIRRSYPPRLRHSLALVLGILMLLPVAAQAQITSINGRISDVSGAVIPNAKVTLTDEATSVELSAVTTGTGDYSFVHLKPGIYDVAVEAQGFASARKIGINLNLDQVVSINLSMKPGAETQVVTVQANQLLLNTSNADRGQIYTQDEIENAPLNGGTPLMLANTAPGVVFNSVYNGADQWIRPFDNSAVEQFSANGQNSGMNDFQLDGAANNAHQFGLRTIGFDPPSSSVQQMKFISNPYDAQYGHTGSGIFDITTKSGTNQLHGQVYENARRTWLDANTHFNNNPLINLPKAGDMRDQYGFELDGPVYVPRLYNGHGKTFFAVQGENWKQDTPQSGVDSVPPLSPDSTTETAAETGDFSGAYYYDGSCGCTKPVTIYDPLTVDPVTKERQPFSGNQIPTARLNSTALKYLSFLPLPNRPTPFNLPWGNSNHVWQNVDADRYQTAMIRLDQDFSERDRGYLRFIWSKHNETRPFNGITGPAAQGTNPLIRQNHFFTADWTHTISNNAIFDLKLSYTRYVESQNEGTIGMDLSKLGLSSLDSVAKAKLFPQTNIDGVTSFGNVGSGRGVSVTNTISGMPMLTLVKGSHTMKMGLDYRWMKSGNFQSGQDTGYFHASSSWTQKYTYQSLGPGDGLGLATWVLGTPSDGRLDISPSLYFSYPYFAPFFQDSWKVNKKLTLNLGLRWDFQGPPSEAHNQIVGDFDTATTNPVAATVSGLPPGVELLGGLTFAGVNGQPTTLYNWNKNLIQPRIGFAYAARDTTVVRGGIGESFAPAVAQGYSEGFSQSTTMITSNSNGTSPDGAQIGDPFPTISFPAGSELGMLSQLGNNFSVSNRHFHIPGVWSYSIGVEQLINSHASMDISYVGSRGINLSSSDNINHINKSFYQSCNILDGATPDRLSDCLSPGNNPAWVTNPFLGNLAFSPAATGNQNGYYNSQLLPASIYARPFPQFGDINQTEQNQGATHYDSLQLAGAYRWNNALTFSTNLVWAKSMTSGFLEDVVYRTRQRHVDPITRPLRFTFNGVWHLPMGRGRYFLRDSNRIVDGLLGGWIMSPVYYYDLGAAVPIPSNIKMTHVNRYSRRRTVESGSGYIRGTSNCVGWYDPNNNYTLGPIPGQRYDLCSSPGQYDFIVLPTFAEQNDISDTGIRQPNGQQLDLAMSKSFQVYDRAAIELRFEGYNVLNHPSWEGVGYWWGISDFQFGTVNMIYNQQNNPARQVQLSAKITW